MQTSWERRKGKKTLYVHVDKTSVWHGGHWGSGHTDDAGSVTHAEFLAGRYQDLVLEDFGPKILAEVIASVRAFAEEGTPG